MSATVNLSESFDASNGSATHRWDEAEFRGRVLKDLDQVRWDELAALRALAQSRSLREAAAHMKISVNTIRARLSRLETALGTTLFARDRQGIRITGAGKAAAAIAREISDMRAGLPKNLGNNTLVREGEIRICASEGISTFWLAPRLPELKASLPDLTLTLNSFSDQTRLMATEHDISVGFEKPDDNEAVVSKLCSIHMLPYASNDYIRRYGHPSTTDQLEGHHYVMHAAPGINDEALDLFIGSEQAKRAVAIRVNSSFALFWAVATGVGIGSLPTFSGAISNKVVPLDLPIQLKFDLWLSYSHAARDSAPVRAAVKWLRDSFDADRYPWFGEKFVHPRLYSKLKRGRPGLPFVDHVVDDT